MSTKTNPGSFDCYKNALPDEPLFVLLGRDPLAGATVRAWAAARARLDPGSKKAVEAVKMAAEMDAWCLSVSGLPAAQTLSGARVKSARLTKSERAAMQGLVDGLIPKTIAFNTDRSESTITDHIRAARQKLGAKTTAQALCWLVEQRTLESFEVWAEARGYSMERSRIPELTYSSVATEHALRGWLGVEPTLVMEAT